MTGERDPIREAFYEREDIRSLPDEEKRRRWEECVPNVQRFMGWIASKFPDTFVIDAPRRERKP